MAHRSAGLPCSLPHTRPESEIRPWRDDPFGVWVARRLCEYGAMPRIIDGCRAAGGNRSTFPRVCDEANVQYLPLIGHSSTAARRREAVQWAQGDSPAG